MVTVRRGGRSVLCPGAITQSDAGIDHVCLLFPFCMHTVWRQLVNIPKVESPLFAYLRISIRSRKFDLFRATLGAVVARLLLLCRQCSLSQSHCLAFDIV